MRHLKALAGNVPFSRSVPVPENESVVPAVYFAPTAGVRIVAIGAVLDVTAKVAELLAAVPIALVTTAR